MDIKSKIDFKSCCLSLFQLTFVVFHQALDSHVIADDEIIEKTHFREPYAVYSNSFKLNIYIPTGKVRRKMHN